MNISNKLTLSRVIIIPFFVGLLLLENVTSDLRVIAIGRWAALILFILATITDYYDGVLARRYNLITSFGQLFDPLADKLLTMAAFVAFVELRVPGHRPIFPAWAIIVILGREFLVTGLRTLAMAKGRLIAADKLGKHKTAWQLGTIIGILVTLCIRDTMINLTWDVRRFDAFLPYLYAVILVIVTTLTAYSGVIYLVKNWDIINENE